MADNEQFAPLLGREVELFATVAEQWFLIPRVGTGNRDRSSYDGQQQYWACPAVLRGSTTEPLCR